MPEPGGGEPRTWTARRVRASGSSILLAIASLVVVVLARDLYLAASQPIGWVAAAASVALVVRPLTDLFDRWVPRGVAILATLVLGGLVLGSVGAGLLVEVQDQLGELREQLPAAAVELEERSGEDGVLARLELGSLVEDLVERTSDRISPEPTIEDAAGTVPAYLVSGVLVVFFLVWGDAILGGLHRQISNPDRRERLDRGATRATRLTQRYVMASLTLGILVALAGGAVAWLAGLPVPLTIGVLLGVASAIPYIGILFGSVPVLILSAASEPASTTLVLVVALVALQAAATVATRRVIEPRTLHVGPAVVVVAALIGSDLYGIGGALVAILAGILGVAAIEAWHHEEGLDAGSPVGRPDGLSAAG